MKSVIRWMTGFYKSQDFQGEIIALHDYKVLYFAIPKVACSSLKSLCADLLKVTLPPDVWKPELFHTSKFDHLINKGQILLRKADLPDYSNYWSFAFVRNPWDRLVSCYCEKIRNDGDPENFINGISKVLVPYGTFKGGMTFEEFVNAVVEIPEEEAEPHFRSQYTFLLNPRGQSLVQFIGRFERMSNDFPIVCERLGISVVLPHLLKSKRRPYKEYYHPRLVEVVARRYEKDITLFDYKFE